MGRFKKGEGGRPKGIPNKRTAAKELLKCEEMLIKHGVFPIAEVLKLLPLLEPRDQVRTYLELQQYIEGKKRVVEVIPDKPAENDASQMPTADLLQIVSAG